MGRYEKLKLFGIVAAGKDLPIETIKDKFAVVLLAAYNQSDAVMGAVASLKQLGKDPSAYVIPFMIASIDAEKFIQMAPLLPSPMPVDADWIEPSAQDIAKYILEVFQEHGTAAQNIAAKFVVNKFLANGTESKKVLGN